MSAPLEGDIISFEPELDAHGHEQQGARLWLVVSVKAYNDAAKLAMVCPITTHQGSTDRANPAEVLLPAGCGATGVVLTFQLQTIDWQARKAKFVGRIPASTL
jgi:mRNA interferase MazF